MAYIVIANGSPWVVPSSPHQQTAGHLNGMVTSCRAASAMSRVARPIIVVYSRFGYLYSTFTTVNCNLQCTACTFKMASRFTN